jgi:hypothetical protein
MGDKIQLFINDSLVYSTGITPTPPVESPPVTPPPVTPPPVPPTPIPPPPSAPIPVDAVKLNGDCWGYYGVPRTTVIPGQARTYLLPLGELVDPNKNVVVLWLAMAAQPEGNGGAITYKLTAPTGEILGPYQNNTPNGTVFVWSKNNGMGMSPNYPYDYVEKGNWLLEVKADVASTMMIQWNPY